jgi:glutathione S-transferase
MYRLYYSPGACSMAVHIVLEEIGEPYELELVSSSGSRSGSMTDTATWRAVNPKGRVPALTPVPGRVGGADNLLTEAHAILIYLGMSHPAAGLLPKEPAAFARAIEWMNWLASNVHAMTYGQIWRPTRFVADEKDVPPVQAKGRDNLVEQYRYIEQLLSDGRDWAVPGAYSVVDPYLLVFFQWGGRIGLPMRKDYPAWTRLGERVMARPAVRRVLEHENVTVA